MDTEEMNYRIDCVCELCSVGLTPAEPEVLTWEQAAALWVEWGGVVAEENMGVFASMRRCRAEEWPYVYRDTQTDRVCFVGDEEANTPEAADIVVTLTHDTLEDMAEACGLPRMSGGRKAVARPKPADQQPTTVFTTGEVSAALSELARVYAEQHAGYKAALDAFCGVGVVTWVCAVCGFRIMYCSTPPALCQRCGSDDWRPDAPCPLCDDTGRVLTGHLRVGGDLCPCK